MKKYKETKNDSAKSINFKYSDIKDKVTVT